MLLCTLWCCMRWKLIEKWLTEILVNGRWKPHWAHSEKLALFSSVIRSVPGGQGELAEILRGAYEESAENWEEQGDSGLLLNF